jgi:CBS domain containing-hemolysin-like protein
MQEPGWQTMTARSVAREPIFVPETLSVATLLQEFRLQRQHIAIVLDEFGGTAGLVTLEDLLEEIVGEVSDPFDVDAPEFQTLPDGTVMIDGLALIEDVNERLGLNLQDPHYDTIAGYALGKLGRIPKVNDIAEADGNRLRVEAMDGLRIARLSLIQRADHPSDLTVKNET